jgi:protoporphyrinogen/coproporphyrinogen III oxidase
MSEPVDLCVVGAGLCGLSAALRARAAGRSVVVLEAAARVGGVIRTERVGAYRVERGAATFPSTAAGVLELAALCPDPPATVEPEPAAARQLLWTAAGLVPVTRNPAGLVASGLLSPIAAARAALEPLLARRRARTPESAGAFVRRRFGGTIADRFLAPMTAGIHGSDPAALGVADAFPALAAMEREHGSVLRALRRRRGGVARRVLTFSGGMESFPRAMGEALGEALRTASPVERLVERGEFVSVETAAGTLRAREVVLAATAREQAALTAAHSAEATEILEAVRYVPMVVVAVGIPPGGSPPIPKAFGFLRGRGARARILGASFPSVVDPSCAPAGHALLTVYLGGGRDPEPLRWDDGRVAAQVEHDLSLALGGPVRPDLVSVHRWERAIPVLSPGHRARMARAQACLAPLRIRLSGSHVTGVGVAACCT